MQKILVLTALVLVLSGCAARLGFQLGSTGRSATEPSVGPGVAFSSSGVGVRLSPKSAEGVIYKD